MAMNAQLLAEKPRLYESMLRDRAKQFVTRHQWRLRVDSDGFELDEYDDDAATYCIVDWQGQHGASLRLRHESQGSMAEAHFSELWREAADTLRGTTEVTRFCAGSGLNASARDAATSALLQGLCRHCIQEKIPRFFGVIYPSVARILTRSGWPPEILAACGRDGKTLLLAEWQANDFVAFDLQATARRKSLVTSALPEISQAA